MDSTTWRATTKKLIEELSKEHEIAPADIVALLKFEAQGARKLEALQAKAEQEEAQRKVA